MRRETSLVRGGMVVAPYALITAYYALVFLGRGLRGGDLDQCVTPRDEVRDAGACPHFAGPLHEDPWNAAVLRYRTWSSRFVVELVEYSLSHSLWLFVIITFALAWLFLWSAQELLNITSAYGLTVFATLFCVLVPPQFHRNAGVYSTVIFYSWSAFLGTFALGMIARRIRGEPVSKSTTVATVAALTFALCSEQFVVAFAVALAVIAYLVFGAARSDLRLPLALYGVLWIGATTNILVCPGNSVRQAREIHYWMPGFAEMSLGTKLMNGLHHALWLIARPEMSTATLVASFALVFFATALTNRSRSAYLPAVGVAAWLGVLISLAKSGVDVSAHGGATISAVGILMLFIVKGSYEVTKGDATSRFMILALFSAGFGSSLLLSFSPTVWASDTRTLLLEYLSLVGIIFLLARCAWRRSLMGSVAFVRGHAVRRRHERCPSTGSDPSAEA